MGTGPLREQRQEDGAVKHQSKLPSGSEQSQDKKHFLLAPPALLVSIRLWHKDWHKLQASQLPFSLSISCHFSLTESKAEADRSQCVQTHPYPRPPEEHIKQPGTSSSGTHCSQCHLSGTNLSFAHLVLSSKSKISSFLKNKSQTSQGSKPVTVQALLLRWGRTDRAKGAPGSLQVYFRIRAQAAEFHHQVH